MATEDRMRVSDREPSTELNVLGNNGSSSGGNSQQDQPGATQATALSRGKGARERSGEARHLDQSQARPADFDILTELQRARSTTVPTDERFSREYPQCWKLLTITEGLAADDNNKTSLVLVPETSGFSCILTAKSVGLSKTIPIKALWSFWKEIEAGLMDQNIPWRQMRAWKEKKDPKKKGEKS